MRLDLFRVFYHVAECGSISGAARALYSSQPAVSQAVRQLEDALGTRLFVRGAKGVSLTPEGELLYGYVERGYSHFLTGEQALKDMLNLAQGEVRIAVSDTLCKHLLLPVIRRFHASYPDIKLRIVNGTTPESLALLARGDAEMAVVHMPAQVQGVLITPVRHIQDCLVAGERYRHLADKELDVADLAALPLLLLERGTNTRTYFDTWLSYAGISVQPEIELGSIDLLVEFARLGLGLALVTRDFVQDELRRGDLFELRLSRALPPRQVGVGVRAGHPMSRAAREFLRLVQITGQGGE